MPAATPTRTMVWGAALQKRGFQVTGPGTFVSPNGTVFTSQEAAWAYVQKVESDAPRLLALWRADHQSPVKEKKDDRPRADVMGAGGIR